MITNKQKALIHIAKSSCGLSEADYVALLQSVGCTSSKQLTQAKFTELMGRFKALGFAYSKKPSPIKKPSRPQPADSKKRLIAKIKAILGDLGLTWTYADGIAQNMFNIDVVAWCTPDQLRRIVAALTYHQQREQKKIG